MPAKTGKTPPVRKTAAAAARPAASPATAPAPRRGVPFVDLRRQYRTLRPRMLEAIDAVCRRAEFVLGPELERFEEEFAALAGTRHAVGVGSGTGALLLALKACGIGEDGPGGEVIVPANTFVSTVLAVRHAGAVPVLVDIEPDTHLIDTEQALAAITPRTRAILPVHLYGQAAGIEALRRGARGRGIRLVEDACQAHGALRNAKPAGSLGDLAAFSFYPGKNLGAYGDGGAVTCSSDRLAARVRELRNIGQRAKNVHTVLGFNERLDSLQAAVLRVKLALLHGWNAARRRAARLYDEGLEGLPVTRPAVSAGNTHVYHLYVIRAPRRNGLARHLRDRGIATGIHYPTPIHRQPCFADLRLPAGSFPRAERAAREILSLPMFPEITPREIATVCGAIREFYGRRPERRGRRHAD